ncbi:uncharacterized protein LOC130451995 [Diorhabda sublineata]|uniref:uncharacterized protein LOC130451995 n=1 Tax=Diorhabda sublineata TaxID=1163346 RepID=UPI0024E0BA70|nr:uncharacterized protein LOC130451995 [Diorhabda sublineata]
MYRSVLVAPEDRHLQKIVWRYSDNKPIDTYQLRTLTYGAAPASFLAISANINSTAGYTYIAKPLSDLLRKGEEFKLESPQREEFKTLKAKLICEPVLHIYQQGAYTEPHTYASIHGYGACLSQRSSDNSKLHPVYYMSRKTTPAEKKYTSNELEELAINKSVKKFRTILARNEITILSDCNAITKTIEKRDLTTRVARWALIP